MADDAAAVTRQLEWEAAQRPRAVAAGVAAGGLLLLGSLYGSVGLKPPRIGVIQGIAPALTGVPDAHVDPRSAGITFATHHTARIIASSAVSAIGIAAISFVLLYLFVATKARKPDMPAISRPLGIAGPIVVALAGLATAVVFSINAKHFVDGTDRSRQAADHVSSGTAAVIVQSLGLLGALALGFAFIVIGLNAMRVGLLTRFMGILAMISGVLFVIPVFGAGLPVVQAFWLIALALVVSGRSPAGLPPSWERGVAVPWPTQQEQREARARQRDGAAAIDKPAPEPVAPPSNGGRSRKRKRKR